MQLAASAEEWSGDRVEEITDITELILVKALGLYTENLVLDEKFEPGRSINVCQDYGME
jgi:hypothetical protein